MTPPVHVLAVDDEPDAIQLLDLVLRSGGYRVSQATCGQEALARLEASLQTDAPVQLMVLDLRLPDMDGLEVLQRVRSQPRLARLPVIIVTGAYSPRQEIAGLEAGADDVIAKPYMTPLLLARVRTLLRARQAEEALGRAEALSHLLVEGMRDMVFIADERGHFTYVSPSAERLTGYTHAEMTSGQITLEWLIHPGDHERVREQMLSALEGQGAEIESRMIRKDGTLLWASISVEPLRDAAGMQGSLRDVTIHHQAEEALRVRSAELAALNLLARRISESLDPQAMLSETLGTLIDVVNAEFGLVYTLSDHQLRVRAWHGLTAARVAEADSIQVTQHLNLTEMQVYRGQSRDDAGEVFPILQAAGAHSWVSLPLRDRGQPLGLLVLASRNRYGFDAAEIDFLAAAGEQIGLGLRNAQLYAEAQRRATELALINQATHAVGSTLNLETVLQTIMSQAIEVLQGEAGSVLLLDQPHGDLVFAIVAGPAGERLRGTRVPLASSFAGQAVREGRSLMIGNAQRDDRLYRRVDGITGLTTENLLAAPLRVRDHIIGVLEVINKREGQFAPADLALLEALAGPAATAIENARLYEGALRHAQEIRRSQAQLIHSEKLAATGRLAVSLAHEINNPLQAIQNLVHLTLEYEISDAKRREFLEMAREETSRLITLVQQTLEFYRPEQAQAGPMDLNATVERVLALARKKLSHSNVQVELQLAKDLPPVTGMPDQMAQVFLNLIVNSAEAMGDGGQLCIESRVSNGHVEMIFADTGPGIAPEDLAHIFEPFYTTKHTGTGLGLAVSYSIVESHQGTLSVDSLPGHGATFTVRLPAAEKVKPPSAKRRTRKRANPEGSTTPDRQTGE